MAAPFYSKGLRFSCKRCSACCRHEPGYVFLRKSDLAVLEKALGITYSEFMDAYCRWIPSENGTLRLSLKEKSNFDCIFWNQKCLVYEHRPLQCRSFPFWHSALASPETWEETAADCPGVNREGTLHSFETIKTWLEKSNEEPVIMKAER